MVNHRDKKHHSSHSSGHRSRRGHGNPDDYSHQHQHHHVHQLDPFDGYGDSYGDNYGAYPSSSSGQVGDSMDYGGTTDMRAPRSPHEPHPFPDSHDPVHLDDFGAAALGEFDEENTGYVVTSDASRGKGKGVEYDDDLLDGTEAAISGAYNDMTPQDLDDGFDELMQEAMRQSRQSQVPIYPGESSSEPSHIHHDLTEPTELDTIFQGMSLEHQQGQPTQHRQKKTPKSRGSQTQRRSSRQSQANSLDFSDFRVEPSWKYRLGAVLKMPWSQPVGHRHNETVTDPTGDPFYTSIRRFIVVNQQPGHSLAVAIYTYGRQGCLKGGVHPMVHGVAYDEQYGDPGLLPQEPMLGFESVPIAILQELIGVEDLDPISRINYAKLHTIEHNAAVKFIGDVTPDYTDYVLSAVDQCWLNQKSPKPRGSGKGGKDKRRR